MHSLRLLSIGLLLAGTLSSCAVMNDREWDGCAIGGGLIGAAVGGVTGGVASNNIDDNPDNATRGGAIAGGIVGGGALGAVLGHLICDPEKAVPAPPPPPPAPPAAAPKKIAELPGADFDFDKAHLKPEGERILDDVIKTLKDSPSVKVSIEGHTDSHGSDAYNVKLSQRRAETVKDYLVKHGIDGSRLTTKAWGESKPKADNKTEAGRAQNRRVELIAP